MRHRPVTPRGPRRRALAATLAETHGRRVEVIRADLADPHGPETLHREITNRGLVVDALVNNAGFGVPGSYAGSQWARQAELLQVLVVALAELTHRLLPGMVERKYGRIINVASLAGLIWRCQSAASAVRVRIGSTTTIFAPRRCASRTNGQ